MWTQRQGIIAAMGKAGWRVVTTVESPDEWWADEFVEFESTWSPIGARLVLTFLVDPQHDRERRKGEAVWNVVASQEHPDSRVVDGPSLSLGAGWQDRLSAFISELEQFRSLRT
jgi:hypothetical protein